MKSALYFHEFWVKVDQHFAKNHDWRYGQSVFNVLLTYRPDLAEKIRGTDLDPFYSDNLSDELHEWLYCHWMD